MQGCIFLVVWGCIFRVVPGCNFRGEVLLLLSLDTEEQDSKDLVKMGRACLIFQWHDVH